MTRIKLILASLLMAAALPVASVAQEQSAEPQSLENIAPEPAAEERAEAEAAEEAINPKEIIFEHLGDGYGWEVPFDHHHRIPLPCIVYGESGWHVFSSSRVAHDKTYTAPDGTEFRIAGPESGHKGKIVEIVDGVESRPWDFSITKNVAALFICVLVVAGLMFWLAAFLRKHPYKAPRKGLGAVEVCVTFVYDGVIKPILGPQAKRFAPYLLTAFFFILVMNLLGLVVVFPGGANLTGNIAITLVLSIFTFLATNLFANKHYWKEILWPPVPLPLKCPIPIMQVIEIFGMFTKPAALTVRLFANMMGGHMIVITLTLLIFIFSAINPVAGGGATLVSLFFSIFMLLIDVLVSFIQAYVFTMLSTIFIGLGQEQEHEKEAAEAHGNIGKEIADTLV